MIGTMLMSVPERDRGRICASLRSRSLGIRFVQPADLLEALRQPPPPDLVLVHADYAGEFDPARVSRLRRQASLALRRLPILALVSDPTQQHAWSQAGAMVAKANLNGEALIRAVDSAIAGTGRWVDSQTYVGPDRRRKKAIFNKSARRLEDSPHLVTERVRSATTNQKVASVDVSQPLATVVRRLRIAGQSLSLEDRDSRARFISEVRAAHTHAVVSGRSKLARSLAELEKALSMAGASGRVDAHHIDALLYQAQEDISA